MAFTLPNLPYAFNVLEPHVDAKTMEIHHGKHHAAYVNNLNAAIQGGDLEKKSIEEICAACKGAAPAVRNNGGGHYNHSLFWQLMAPKAGGEPGGKLGEAIKKTFTSFDEFKKQFADAGVKRFGSGWAWLVVAGGELKITSTPNQDNPLMKGLVDVEGTPVLGLDVWEHAYYLNYQNRRPDYITAWWNVVNWKKAEELYAAAK